jgi:hypothetical protein
MKYYKITDVSVNLENHKKGIVADVPSANGEFVTNGKQYFDRIGKREIIKDTPVFDYFHLQSFGPKEEWEWCLQDVHGGAYDYPTGGYWFISDDFKLLLENFKIAPDYHFYETRLLYKGNKLKYWIFQFPINPLQNYDYEKSEYFFENERITGLKTAEEFDDYDYSMWKKTKKNVEWRKTVLIDVFDFVVNMNGDKLVSENLKNAIEAMKLEGLEFFEIDYEVIT